MVQESQKFAEIDGLPATPESPHAAQVAQPTHALSSLELNAGNTADGDPALRPAAGPAASDLPSKASIGLEQLSGTVVLDEANDLLVITEPGALLPPRQGGWADTDDVDDAVPETISEATASWAQEILAADAEATSRGGLNASPRPQDFIEPGGGADTALQTLDWIDW